MLRNNVILADCQPKEIESFAEGCNTIAKNPFKIISSISNWEHGSILQNLRRYVAYFIFPLNIFFRRGKYEIILGWQQFYALNLAFFCRLFHTKKRYKIFYVFSSSTGSSFSSDGASADLFFFDVSRV